MARYTQVTAILTALEKLTEMGNRDSDLADSLVNLAETCARIPDYQRKGNLLQRIDRIESKYHRWDSLAEKVADICHREGITVFTNHMILAMNLGLFDVSQAAMVSRAGLAMGLWGLHPDNEEFKRLHYVVF